MPRPRSKPVQPSLILDPQDLVWVALEKVRASGDLSPEELAALEQAARGELPRQRRRPGWQKVVNCWLEEFERATHQRAPRPKDNEMRQLMNVFNRLGGDVERTCELIRAFWPWRRSNEFRSNVPPDTFGFERHLPSIIEFAELLATKRKSQKQFKAAAEHAALPSEPPPSPTDEARRKQQQRAREVIVSLSQKKSFDGEEAQAINDRRRLLDEQARMLTDRQPVN